MSTAYDRWILISTLILAFGSLCFVLQIVFLSRHKKTNSGRLQLKGRPAVAHTVLNPEGAVLVDGELWRARSADGSFFEANANLRVVGSADHLLLVEAK